MEKQPNGYTSLEMLRESLGTITQNDSNRSDNTGAAQDCKTLLKRASAALKRKLQVHDNSGDRSSAAFAAMMLAMNEGFTDKEIKALVEAYPNGFGERYIGTAAVADLTDEISRIRNEWQTQVNDCERLAKKGKSAGLPDGCWGLVVRIHDPDGKSKEVIIPWRDLNVSSGDRDPVGKLRDQGLHILSTVGSSEVRDFLTRSKPTAIARSIDRTGWQGDKAFALPDRIIGAPDEPLIWDGDRSRRHTMYEAAGTLADWQTHVPRWQQIIPCLSLVFVKPWSVPSSTSATLPASACTSLENRPQERLLLPNLRPRSGVVPNTLSAAGAPR